MVIWSELEVTNCDLKFMGRKTISPLCFYGTRRCNAFWRAYSDKAALVNMEIMRAFVRMRNVITTYMELTHKLDDLEKAVNVHDKKIESIMEAIRQLMIPPEKPKRPIGFRVEDKAK